MKGRGRQRGRSQGGRWREGEGDSQGPERWHGHAGSEKGRQGGEGETARMR